MSRAGVAPCLELEKFPLLAAETLSNKINSSEKNESFFSNYSTVTLLARFRG